MIEIYDALPFAMIEHRGDTHIVPQNDTHGHLFKNCWCKPTNYGDVISHNSADHREDYAEYGRKVN